jgi:hypothetical protein
MTHIDMPLSGISINIPVHHFWLRANKSLLYCAEDI